MTDEDISTDKQDVEKNIVDTRKQMKYIMTIKLANGREVDVYEISPNVYKYVFKPKPPEGKKEEEGFKLIPEE
jgi:hypothetical protein